MDTADVRESPVNMDRVGAPAASGVVERGSFLPVFLVAACSTAFLYWSLPWGPGATTDSVIYLMVGRNVAAGEGLTLNGSPLTHFPPAYPLLLSATTLLGRQELQAIRLLHSLLFGLNVLLFGCAAYFASERSRTAAVCGALVFGTSSVLLETHAMMHSEPFFISCALAGFILVLQYVRNGRDGYLVAAGVILGLAMITRYSGCTLLPPVILVLLLKTRHAPVWSQARRILMFLLIACAPLAVWLTRNSVMAGTATNRTLAFHPVAGAAWESAAHAVRRLVFPPAVPSWVESPGVLLLILALGAAIIIFRRTASGRSIDPAASLFILAFTVCYSVFLAVAASFVDAQIPMDARLLSPLFVFGLIAIITMTTRLVSLVGSVRLRRWVLSLFGLFLLLQIAYSAGLAVQFHRDGRGFTSRAWRESKTIELLRRLPGQPDIYSNEAAAIQFLAERPARALPLRLNPGTNAAIPGSEKKLEAVCMEVERSEAVVVYFVKHQAPQYPSLREVQEVCRCGGRMLPDARIFGL